MNTATNPTAVVPFNFDSTEIRTIPSDNDNPLFVAVDVAMALGYANTSEAISRHCKGVAKHYPLQTAGGIQNVRVITEPDLYRLVIGSNLPSAQKFENWIFEEVLPAIRKTGKYQQAAPADTMPALSGSEFRTVFFNDIALTIFTDEDGSQWFRAKDLGQILGKNRSSGADTAYIKNLVRDGATRMLRPTIDGKAYCPSVFIDQTGLSEVIMRSTSPTVKPFSRFIMKVASGVHVPARQAPAPAPFPMTVGQALRDRMENSRFLVSFGPKGETIFEEVLGYRVGMNFRDIPGEKIEVDSFYRRSELPKAVIAELPRV